MRDILYPLLIRACPLMMLFMHGGHRHGGHAAHGHDEDSRGTSHIEQGGNAGNGTVAALSTEELLQRRSELDREIRVRSSGSRAAS